MVLVNIFPIHVYLYENVCLCDQNGASRKYICELEGLGECSRVLPRLAVRLLATRERGT